MLGSLGMGMAPELHQDVWRGQEKFQMTNFTMPNNSCSMKYALKSVSGLADVGVPQGIGDGPRAPSRGLEGVRKKFKMTNYYRPNNVSSMKFALKSVPGFADVGVPHGDGVRPGIPSRAGLKKVSNY